MKNIAPKIKQLREEANLTPTELSRKSGLSLAYISRLEKGDYKAPSLVACKSLSDALGITLKVFLEKIEFIKTNKYTNKSSFQLLSSTLRGNGFTPEQSEKIIEYAKFIQSRNSKK